MKNMTYDVAVAGGGVSGVCAALASSRAGKRTVLIQNRPILGGNSSSEIRVWTRGAVGGGSLYAEEMGILGELKLENLHKNPEANPILWDEVLLDAVLAQQNLDLYLNTHMTDVEMEGEGRIKAIRAFQMGSETDYRIEAGMFIDATGDGTLAYKVGALFRIGREEKEEFGESLAAEGISSHVLGSSVFFQSRKADKPIRFVKPDFAYGIEEIQGLLNRGGRVVNEEMNGCDYWWVEFGGIKDTIKDNNEIALELRKVVYGIWNYIKNSGKFPADNLTLEWVGSLPGKRESRRFTGAYLLNQNDLEQNRKFEDAVCYGGWYMDFHPSEGIYSNEEFCVQIPVSAYDIPMRSLYSDQVENLLYAGRIISVTHAAFSSTRVMDTCGLVGQASGEIAAYALEHHLTVAEANQSEHVTQIQQSLLRQDLGAFGMENKDQDDLAAKASIESNGCYVPGEETVDGYLDIREGTFLVIPAQSKTIGLRVTCSCDTLLSGTIYQSDLPSRFLDGEQVDSLKIQVKKDQEVIDIPLHGADQERYIKIVWDENSDVKIALSAQSLTGFLAGYKDSPRYVTPAVICSLSPYEEKQVANGQNRIYKKTNLWVGQDRDSRPNSERTEGRGHNRGSWLEFSWNREQTIEEIRCTFNPGLELELPSSITISDNPHHGFTRRTGEPAQLVKNFDLYAEQGKELVKIVEIRNNYQRLCVVPTGKLETRKIRLVFHETWGKVPAEVFEVRIY